MEPFTLAEIQGGILKDHLMEEDYLAPHKVDFIFYKRVTNIHKRIVATQHISQHLLAIFCQ